jgi:hypothetical protein
MTDSTQTVLGDRIIGDRIAELCTDVFDATIATRLRFAFETNGYQRYRLLDRGRYQFIETSFLQEMSPMIALASTVTKRSVTCVSTRVIRLKAGDFLLAHHDQFDQDLPIELTVDISQHAVPDADIVYRRRGQAFFSLPARPLCAAVVERGPAVNCHHSYISKRNLDAEIVRIVMKLR